jgi:hypothetical protein
MTLTAVMTTDRERELIRKVTELVAWRAREERETAERDAASPSGPASGTGPGLTGWAGGGAAGAACGSAGFIAFISSPGKILNGRNNLLDPFNLVSGRAQLYVVYQQQGSAEAARSHRGRGEIRSAQAAGPGGPPRRGGWLPACGSCF